MPVVFVPDVVALGTKFPTQNCPAKLLAAGAAIVVPAARAGVIVGVPPMVPVMVGEGITALAASVGTLLPSALMRLIWLAPSALRAVMYSLFKASGIWFAPLSWPKTDLSQTRRMADSQSRVFPV